jgi:hypothetical protein
MMTSRSSQHSSSSYVAMSQAERTPLQPSQEHHCAHEHPVPDDVDSLSLGYQCNDNADELPTSHLTQTAAYESASIVARASDHSHKESRTDGDDGSAILPPKNEWQSWSLSWWFNLAVLITEIGFIVAIIVLDRLSARNDGITTVPDIESSSFIISLLVIPKIQQYYGLLWTSLPSLIFTLYSFAWATVVAASYERQPLVELQRGGNASRTIMLDYRTYPEFYRWVLAFMHDHIHVGCAMLLSLIVSLAVVPLSAHLLVAAASTHQFSVPLSFATQYNDSLPIASTNLQPFIDIATAVHAYGSTPPAWMTTEYAFAPFSSTADTTTYSSHGSTSANMSANTNAYSAYLDCQALNSSSYIASYHAQGSDPGIGQVDDVGTLTIDFSDRSCSVQLLLGLSSNTPTYAKSWFATCDGQATNRLGMLAGTYSSSSRSKLTEFSVISCIPSYWHSTGPLTVSLNGASTLASNYIAFTERTSTAMQPAFHDTFEFGLPEYTIYNAAAATNADALGFSILSAANTAAGNDAKAAMATDSILNATELVFTTVYAALATSKLLTPTQRATKGSGVLSEPVNRLFMVHPIAYTIVVVLALVLASHVVLWIYAMRHRSVLSEEPIGLLGNAVLLERSDLSAVVGRVRKRCGKDENVREGLKKRFDVEEARCFWDEREGRIRVEGLAEK